MHSFANFLLVVFLADSNIQILARTSALVFVQSCTVDIVRIKYLLSPNVFGKKSLNAFREFFCSSCASYGVYDHCVYEVNLYFFLSLCNFALPSSKKNFFLSCALLCALWCDDKKIGIS